MMENYENLTLEQLKLYKESIEEYASESELLEVEKIIKELEDKASTIEQNLSGVTTRVSSLEGKNDRLDTRLTSAESKITDDAIVTTVTSSKTYKDALLGKVDTSTYNSKMEQLDNNISLKATTTEVYTKNQADAAFDTKGSAAMAKSEAISSAKSYTDTAITDMATKEYVTNQGYLTATSDVITSKVSKNDVISAINQTAESVSINASKINLNGAVTFSSFDNPLQTAINNKAETIDLEDVRTTANKAQTSINNLEIGGRNLIVERNVSNGWVNHSGTLINSSEYIATDYIPVTPGATITFQLWTPSSTQTWINDTYFDSDKNYITSYDGEYVISNHIVRTYTVPAGASYVRMSYGWATGYKVKLEKGNKPTDWSPAPEDVDAGISAAQTAVDMANKTIEQTQKNLDNLTIGGRNLLAFETWATTEGVDSEYEKDDGTFTITTFGNLNIIPYVFGEVGTQYTAKVDPIDQLPTNARLIIGVYKDEVFSDKYTLGLGGNNTYTDYQKTFNDCNAVRINYSSLNDGPVIIKNAKIEKGNKATDWISAQEDVEYSIEDVKNSSIEELKAFSDSVVGDISTIDDEITNLKNTDSNIQKFSEDNSLIARGFASIVNGILTLQNANSNFSLRLDNEGLILFNGNTKVAYLVVDESLGSALKAENTIQSTIKLRTANGSKGNMGIVARTIGDTGHVSLKAVK